MHEICFRRGLLMYPLRSSEAPLMCCGSLHLAVLLLPFGRADDAKARRSMILLPDVYFRAMAEIEPACSLFEQLHGFCMAESSDDPVTPLPRFLDRQISADPGRMEPVHGRPARPDGRRRRPDLSGL